MITIDSEDELQFVVHCLRVARDRFNEDAKEIAASDISSKERLIDQFHAQAKRADAIASELEG